jgi:hypothetical protein
LGSGDGGVSGGNLCKVVEVQVKWAQVRLWDGESNDWVDGHHDDIRVVDLPPRGGQIGSHGVSRLIGFRWRWRWKWRWMGMGM